MKFSLLILLYPCLTSTMYNVPLSTPVHHEQELIASRSPGNSDSDTLLLAARIQQAPIDQEMSVKERQAISLAVEISSKSLNLLKSLAHKNSVCLGDNAIDVALKNMFDTDTELSVLGEKNSQEFNKRLNRYIILQASLMNDALKQ